MEKDKDGYHLVKCGAFDTHSANRNLLDVPEVFLGKGVITQVTEHPKRDGYPGSDGARIPVTLADHKPERSEREYLRKPQERLPERPIRKIMDGQSGKRDVEEIVDSIRNAAYQRFLNATYEESQVAQVPAIGASIMIGNMLGIHDQLIMYCGAIEKDVFGDSIWLPADKDRRTVLKLIGMAKGNHIVLISKTPSGRVFMTTYKDSTIGRLIQDPMRTFKLSRLHRGRKPEYSLDSLFKDSEMTPMQGDPSKGYSLSIKGVDQEILEKPATGKILLDIDTDQLKVRVVDLDKE